MPSGVLYQLPARFQRSRDCIFSAGLDGWRFLAALLRSFALHSNALTPQFIVKGLLYSKRSNEFISLYLPIRNFNFNG